MPMVFLGQVAVFSITGCPFCARAKRLLTELEVPFVDINLEKFPERRYEMQERTGRRTVPQIFFNAKHIGGYDNLKKLVSLIIDGTQSTQLVCVARPLTLMGKRMINFHHISLPPPPRKEKLVYYTWPLALAW